NSGDLEETALVTVPRAEVRRFMMSGLTPITSHVAAIGMAEMILRD
ncbi:MAG: NUDIX hydrolase, partial [Roseibium sp.]|nr:NUDIX hydrolase [Roseibium sp.]